MRTIMAIVCLGLMMWAGPASAQKTYSLSVSHHPSIRLSDEEVDNILAAASKMLKKPGHTDTPDNVACDVTFKRRGPVKPFASPNAKAEITTEAERDAVHREDSDVKVVKKIEFCRPNMGDTFDGCAWPPRSGRRPISIIVIHKANEELNSILWAHEIGHRKGLWHRSERRSLMTVCDLAADQVRVTRSECKCLLRKGRCSTPEPKDISCELRRP